MNQPTSGAVPPEKTPTQFSSNPYVLLLKKFMHTKFGAMVAYYLGVKGFNRIEAVHSKFLRIHEGEQLGTKEFLQRLMNAAGEEFLGVYRKNTKFGYAYNSRVNKGADLIASLITGAAQNSISSPLPPKYIALQDTGTLTPAYSDTTLTHECVQTGLTRALGTQGSYTGPGTTLDGAASYQVTKTFTNSSAGSVTIYSAALFDAASSGNMFVEANLSASVILAINDTLAITWTVNL